MSDKEKNKSGFDQLIGPFDIAKGINDLTSKIDSLSKAATNLPAIFNKAVTGVKDLTTASLRFIATPVGAVIAALAAAFAALNSWFNRTKEGQNALSIASAVFSHILERIFQVVDLVGEAIFNAFSNPKQALTELTGYIKDHLISRFQAIGKMAGSIAMIFSNDWKNGLKEFGNGLLQFTTGIDNMIERTSSLMDNVINSSIEAAKIQEEKNKLQVEEIAWISEKVKLELKLSRLKREGKNTEARQVEKQIAFGDYNQKRKKYEQIKKENALLPEKQRTNEKVKAENNAEADMYRSLKTLEEVGADDYKKEKELREQLEKELIKLKEESEQKELELLDESFEKKRIVIEQNYAKEKKNVENQEKELLKTFQEAERLKWEKEGNKGEYDATGVVLPENLQQEVDKKYKLVENAKLKAEENLANEIDKMYNEERLRFADGLKKELDQLDKFYEERLKKAEGNETLIALLQANKQRDEQNAIHKHALAITKFETDLAIREMNINKNAYLFKSDLRKKELDQLIKYNDEKIGQLELINESERTQEETQALREAKVAQAEYNAELEKLPAQKAVELLDGIKKISTELSKLDGDLGKLFSGVAGQIDNIKIGFDQNAGTFDQISAGISGVVSVINMISSASKKRDEAEKEFYRNKIALAHEYALALNEQLRLQSEISGSSFVTNYKGKIDDGFKSLANATDKYNEAVSKLSEGKAKKSLKNSIDWGNVGTGLAGGAAAGAAVGALVGSVVPVIGTAIGAVVGGIAGFLFGKKKKNKYGGLLEVFPELVNGAGELDKELAQVLISTDQLDDNTKQLIQNALDWADEIEKAKEQIKEVVSSLAGDLGNDLNKAIVDAWKNGEDASKSMFDAASKSLENFIQNLLYSTLFSDIFSEFENRLVDSLSPDGDGDILDDYDWLMMQMDERDEAYVALLEAIQKRGAEKGYNMWEKPKVEIDYGLSLQEMQKELDQLVTMVDLTSERIGKSFEKNMSDAILHMIKSKHLTEKLNEWYQHFTVAMEDGLLTEDETDRLRKEYQQTVEQSNKLYKDAMNAAGLDIPDEREATAKGIASMSQDSADELNGNFYALIYLVDDIHNILQKRYGISDSFNLAESVQNSVLPTMADMLSVSRSSNTYLLDIRNNTSHLLAIDNNLANMNYNIMAIRNDGLKMRS